MENKYDKKGILQIEVEIYKVKLFNWIPVQGLNNVDIYSILLL